MGIKNVHGPGCCCCCQYTASDGNHYTDAFDSLDSGWLKTRSASDISVSGGKFVLDSNAATPPIIAYRQTSVSSWTNALLILEAEVHALDSDVQSCGVFIHNSSTPNTVLGIFTQWCEIRQAPVNTPDNYISIINAGSAIISQVLMQEGDLLTLELRDVGSSKLRPCYFVNNEPIIPRSHLIDHPAGTNICYGFHMVRTSVNDATAEFDNFTIHKGNP